MCVGIHFDALLVAQYDLFGGRQERLRASVVKYQRIDERKLELQSRLADHSRRGAQANEQRQLALAEHVERGANEIQDEEHAAGCKPPLVELHG